MTEVSKHQVVDLIQKTTEVNTDIEKTTKVDINDLDKTAEKYSGKTSEFLAAIVGGVLGLSGGYGITFLGASLILSGPFGLAFGAAAGLLLWRGRGQQKIEKANKNNAAIKTSLLNEIKSIPNDAPPSIKAKLWEAYNNATEIYEKQVIEGLSDNTSSLQDLRTKNLILETQKVLEMSKSK